LYVISLSIICGLFLRFFKNFTWAKYVKVIFKDSISDSYSKIIADYLINNIWNTDLKSFHCTFLYVNIQPEMQIEGIDSNIDQISHKMNEIEKIIKNNFGVINNINFKEFICYFGNPGTKTKHHQLAVNCAYQIQNAMKSLNIGKIYLSMHSKEEIFKYSNTNKQNNYTFFGNSFDILQAMNKYAKKFNISYLISEAVYRQFDLKLPVRMLDRIIISGLNTNLRLFELLNEKDYAIDNKFYDYYHAGLKLFERQKFKEAASYFKQCLKIRENDVISKIYLERSKEFLYVPPKEGWDGYYEIEI
jgi:tetratricopeptide (TPR) repeat protein